MRNNNPDIIIHNLIHIKATKSKCKYHSYDYSEELAIKAKEREFFSIIQAKQLCVESQGCFIRICHENIKYNILVKAGHSTFETICKFITKLNNRHG